MNAVLCEQSVAGRSKIFSEKVSGERAELSARGSGASQPGDVLVVTRSIGSPAPTEIVACLESGVESRPAQSELLESRSLVSERVGRRRRNGAQLVRPGGGRFSWRWSPRIRTPRGRSTPPRSGLARGKGYMRTHDVSVANPEWSQRQVSSPQYERISGADGGHIGRFEKSEQF